MVFLKRCERLYSLNSNGKIKITEKFLIFTLGLPMSPDKSNENLVQNITTTLRLAKIFPIDIFILNHQV